MNQENQSSQPQLSQLLQPSKFMEKQIIEKKAIQQYQTESMDSRYNREYSSAFEKYIRYGIDIDLPNMEVKSGLKTHNKNDSGYLLTERMHEKIKTQLNEVVSMRSISNVIDISSDYLEVMNWNKTTDAQWLEDNAMIEENAQELIGLEVKKIYVNKLFSQQIISPKLLDDIQIDIQGFMTDEFVKIFTKAENKAFINGNGKNQPKGILANADNIKVIKSEDGKITRDSLLKLCYSLEPAYMRNAVFIMNSATLQHIILSLYNDKNGECMSHYSSIECVSRSSNAVFLFGVQVIIVPEMPDIQPSNYAIAIGDFKSGYTIVDRYGIRVLRDPFTSKPWLKLFADKSLGGDVVNYNALRLFQI